MYGEMREIMKQCKYCQAELAENGSFCPVCGKNNDEELEQLLAEEAAPVESASAEETAPQEKPKATPGKIAAAVVAVIVLAAMLIGLLAGSFGAAGKPQETVPESTAAPEETVPVTEATIPADGNPDDETCKGTYTASDEEVIANANTVVATMGDYQLTNADLQVYYWLEVQSFLSNYGSYAYYFGLDYTQPLDMQVCYLNETVQESWQQFFLASALHTWQNYQAMYAEAEANGFQLSQEDLDELANMEQSLEEQAAGSGFENAKAMLEYNVGAGATIADYIKFNQVYYKGYQYYSQLCDAIEITDAEVEAHFQSNEAAFAEQGVNKEDRYVDVRHILIMPEGGTTDENGVTTYSDEEWAAAQQKAQEILDQWLAGDKSEDSFAELANQNTQDGNDANYDGIPDGGLYTNVVKGQMVEPFENWCFDETRTAGDTGLVQTTYGWHVMYFVGSEPVWESYAENDLLGQRITTLIEEITAKYPMTVDYSSILLGYVDMSA